MKWNKPAYVVITNGMTTSAFNSRITIEDLAYHAQMGLTPFSAATTGAVNINGVDMPDRTVDLVRTALIGSTNGSKFDKQVWYSAVASIRHHLARENAEETMKTKTPTLISFKDAKQAWEHYKPIVNRTQLAKDLKVSPNVLFKWTEIPEEYADKFATSLGIPVAQIRP